MVALFYADILILRTKRCHRQSVCTEQSYLSVISPEIAGVYRICHPFAGQNDLAALKHSLCRIVVALTVRQLEVGRFGTGHGICLSVTRHIA